MLALGTKHLSFVTVLPGMPARVMDCVLTD